MSNQTANGGIVQVQPETEAEGNSKMTGILHQFVSEEIDKQTKMELEILKLNDRIQQLQRGIKQYNDNEVHLRLIISIYEDKINRLSQVEKKLN